MIQIFADFSSVAEIGVDQQKRVLLSIYEEAQHDEFEEVVEPAGVFSNEGDVF